MWAHGAPTVTAPLPTSWPVAPARVSSRPQPPSTPPADSRLCRRRRPPLARRVVGRAGVRHRRRHGGQHRRRARPAGDGPPLTAGRAPGAVRPHEGHGLRRPRGPPPPHPPTPLPAFLHRRRRRVAPPLPQQPRSGRSHHGRPRPHPGGDLPPGKDGGSSRAPRRLRRRRPGRDGPPLLRRRDGCHRCCGRAEGPGRAGRVRRVEWIRRVGRSCRVGRFRAVGPFRRVERVCRRCRSCRERSGRLGPPGRRSEAARSRPGAGRGRTRSSHGSTWGRGCGAIRSRARCARSPGSGRLQSPRCGT